MLCSLAGEGNFFLRQKIGQFPFSLCQLFSFTVLRSSKCLRCEFILQRLLMSISASFDCSSWPWLTESISLIDSLRSHLDSNSCLTYLGFALRVTFAQALNFQIAMKLAVFSYSPQRIISFPLKFCAGFKHRCEISVQVWIIGSYYHLPPCKWLRGKKLEKWHQSYRNRNSRCYGSLLPLDLYFESQ